MSGSFNVTTSNQYISGHVSWSESNVSDTNNTSDVTATMYLSRTNTGYTSYGTDTFNVTINGTTHSNTLSYSLTYDSNTQMVTGTTTVTHNSDGSKSITISWSGGGGSNGVFSVNSGSGTATLTTIPRASTVSSSISFTAGIDTLAVSINRASSSFTHTVEVQVNSHLSSSVDWVTVATRTGVGASTTITFSSSEVTSIYQNMKQYENMQCRIYLITYDGSSQIGTSYSSTGTVYGAQIGKISFSNFNIGDSIPATISPMYSGFTYTAIMTFGSWSKTWSLTVPSSGTSLSTTLTFTSTDIQNMYAQIPTANSGTGNVEITTQYGGIDVNDGNPSPQYDPNFGFTCYVKAGSSNPTFGSSYTYADSNGTTSGITGNNQYIVQNQSTLQVAFPSSAVATAINAASMSYYLATVNSTSVRLYVPSSAPGLSSVASSTNTLAAGTYYARYTWVHNDGTESLPSPESSITLGSGQNLVVNIPSRPSGVASANIYVGTSSGGEHYVSNLAGTSVQYGSPLPTTSATVPSSMYFNMGKVNSSSNTSLNIQAVDSRGNSTTTSITITMVAYAPPVVTTTSKRENGFDAATDIALSGTYSLISVGGVAKNSLATVQFTYKKTTDASYPAATAFSYTTSSGSYTATTVTETLDNTLSWDVEVTVSDKLTTTTITTVVGPGSPLLFIDVDKSAVGVGQFPTGASVLEVGGVVTADKFHATNNGNGTNIQVGDDAWIGDINISNTLSIKGNENNSLGYVRFGSDGNGLGYNGTNLEYGGNFTVDGNFAVKGGIAATRLAQGTDLNTIKNSGYYDVISPANGISGLTWHNLHVYCSADSGYVTQTVFGMTEYEGYTWTRTLYSNSTWTPWRRNLTDGDWGIRSFVDVNLNADLSVAAATWTRVSFQTTVYDVHGEWNGYQFQPKNQGIYHVSIGLYMGGNGSNYMNIYKNGVNYRRCAMGYNGEVGHVDGGVSMELNSSDYIDVRIYCSAATSTSSNAEDNWMTIVQLA